MDVSFTTGIAFYSRKQALIKKFYLLLSEANDIGGELVELEQSIGSEDEDLNELLTSLSKLISDTDFYTDAVETMFEAYRD